jgi:MoaA/NifB/PqqE/SkfB family radical SAM enzyme
MTSSSAQNNLFWNTHELKQMHIELTNACNAACPMCVRFYNNSPLSRPDLEIGQITVDKFKKYFPADIVKKCELILFCGVHGDPCVARDLLEICQYIDQVSPRTAVRINTNGGMRRPDWWVELGQLFSKHTRKNSNHWLITFSIDGLEDTNHLYRRNVKWQNLMENVEAFINSGGTAAWDYLIFKHNEHQIDQAKALSEQLGFDEFIPKKALGVDDGINLKPMPVLDKNGKFEYVIEAPADPRNRNLENPQSTQPLRYWEFNLEDYKKLKSQKNTGKNFQEEVATVYEKRILTEDNSRYDSCSIKCKSKTWSGGKEIFVDNFGRVMPCCYIGTHLNGVYSDTRTLQLHKHMNDYGWEHFSLDLHSLEEILTGGHLDRVFADSWTKDSVANGKLSYCADTCGIHSSIDRIFSHEINDKTKQYNSIRG